MSPYIRLHYGFHVVTVLVLCNDNQDGIVSKNIQNTVGDVDQSQSMVCRFANYKNNWPSWDTREDLLTCCRKIRIDQPK